MQTNEVYELRAENQNLQADLKNLMTIEQALRGELAKTSQRANMLDEQTLQMKNRIMEDYKKIAEVSEENENLKRDVMQCHKIIEIGSQENQELKNEINALREELMKKYQADNQSATAISDKERQIYELRDEIGTPFRHLY